MGFGPVRKRLWACRLLGSAHSIWPTRETKWLSVERVSEVESVNEAGRCERSLIHRFRRRKRTPSPAWSTGEMRARESSGAATGGLVATRTSRTERKQWRWVSILLDQNEAGGSG